MNTTTKNLEYAPIGSPRLLQCTLAVVLDLPNFLGTEVTGGIVLQLFWAFKNSLAWKGILKLAGRLFTNSCESSLQGQR